MVEGVEVGRRSQHPRVVDIVSGEITRPAAAVQVPAGAREAGYPDPLEVVRRLRSWFPPREVSTVLAGDLVALLAATGPMSPDELTRLTSEALGSTTLAELDTAIGKTVAELAPHKIVRGKVIKVLEEGIVVVDVNYKAEGQISIEEFPDPLAVVPIVAIPTTYAGSEMTPIYGLTEGGAQKTGRDAKVVPRTVIYDPLLTLGLPSSATAAWRTLS